MEAKLLTVTGLTIKHADAHYESNAQPAGVQLKIEAKLLTVIGLITKHADAALYLQYIQYVYNV